MRNGLFERRGELIYYKDDVPFHAGAIKENGDIYYIGHGGKAVKGKYTVHSNMANGILKHGTYLFGADCKLVSFDKDKNGLFTEGDQPVYYRDGHPTHAGVIREGEDIYYISDHGYAVKGRHNIHREMANGILERGTYTFGDDYKLIPGSYIPPKKRKSRIRLNKIYQKLQKSKKKVLITALVLFVLMIGIAGIADYRLRAEERENAETPNAGIPVTDTAPDTEEIKVPEVILPTFDEEVLLCSEDAKLVYDGEIDVSQAISGERPYSPFRFEYSLVDKDGTLLISESEDMSGAKEYPLPADEKLVTVGNLKTGTTYYYKVTVGEEEYPVSTFKTAESTRFVYMPGVKNTRDIGGYTTLDGKRVKQGMLIRGTEIDGLVEPSYFLDKDSVDYVKETFGFVCDLDLREASLFSGKYKSRLGEDVKHRFYTSPQYGMIFSAGYQPALRQIFADLANPSNYPMYLHCTYGADRTGTICFLLEGVLNLPEEVMQADYQLTGYFSSSYAVSSSYNSIYGGLEGYAGKTVQEKIVSYLTSPEVGVTEKEIQSIRNIFLEK